MGPNVKLRTFEEKTLRLTHTHIHSVIMCVGSQLVTRRYACMANYVCEPITNQAQISACIIDSNND